MDENTKKSIIEAYEAGSTTREIEALSGISHGAISNYLRAWGVAMRSPRRLGPFSRIDEKTKSKIISLYESGCTTAEIGSKYGAYKGTVGKHLQKWGVKLRPPYKFSSKKDKRIVDLYENGYSAREIAAKLKSNRMTVLDRLKKCGVKIRPHQAPNKLRVSEEKLASILEDHRAGMSNKDLAQKYQSDVRGICTLINNPVASKGKDVILEKLDALKKEVDDLKVQVNHLKMELNLRNMGNI